MRIPVCSALLIAGVLSSPQTLAADGVAYIPVFAARCHGPKAVEGTRAGQVLINGRPAAVDVFNANYLEASVPGFTARISRLGRDLMVTYSESRGKQGRCRIYYAKFISG